MFWEGRNGLAPIGSQGKEAVMYDISDDASFETFMRKMMDAQHLQAAYWLTCYQAETGIILGLARVGGDDPAGIEWSIPIQVSNQSALVKVLDDGTLKFIGGSYGVIFPKPRPQESPPPPASR